MYRIKNWKKFQHYKDRRPPWIKLYTELLDDAHGYLPLSDRAKVTLFHCWMAGAMIWNPEKEVEPLLPQSLERLRLVIRTSFRTTSARTLKEIVSAGYLISVASDYNNLHTENASIPLAENLAPKEEVYKEEIDDTEKEKELKAQWDTYDSLTRELISKTSVEYFDPYAFQMKHPNHPNEVHIHVIERLLEADAFLDMKMEPWAAIKYAETILKTDSGNIQSELYIKEQEEKFGEKKRR